MSYFYLKSEVFIKKKFIHVCFRFTYNFYIGVAENKCVFVFDAFPFGLAEVFLCTKSDEFFGF